jgi:hypothetical protein
MEDSMYDARCAHAVKRKSAEAQKQVPDQNVWDDIYLCTNNVQGPDMC